ncbi:MAG: hypothetical protein PHE83_03040 [Opitutaceae bacterium]|nr:hypothetical protein [Opitutaceae bacterium]
MMPLRLPSVVVTAAVTLLLALHWWLGVSAQIGTTVTNDETAHLVSGYSYWRFDDYRLQPENGNLPQRWGAVPLLAMHPRLRPADDPLLWGASHVWRIGYVFFFGSGNNTDYMLFCARAIMAFWGVATGLLVFLAARRLWGDASALLSLGLYAFSTTTLAHGPLVTSDMCATFWLLAATSAWWRLTGRLTWANLALSCLATGFAFVAKFTCVLLLPVFVLLMVWRVLNPASLLLALGGSAKVTRHIMPRWKKLAVLLVTGLTQAVVAWVVIWTFFGWRYSASAPGLPPAWKYYVPWEIVLPSGGFWRSFFDLSRAVHWLPDAYLQGFAYMQYAADGRSGFLLGTYSNEGWWWFFPYAFLAKSTLGELLAAFALLAAAAIRWLHRSAGLKASNILYRDLQRLAPWLTLGGMVGITAVVSHLNIGHRHILTVYPLVALLAGALLRPFAAPWLRAAGLVALLSTVVESTIVRPHYLAFFNAAVGGPSAGWRQLVDSSLDWGQDLPALAKWVRHNRRPDEPVFVSYFGTGSPFYEGLQAQELSPYYTYGRPRRWVEMQPGLYCISATMLEDVYSPFRGEWTRAREAAYQRLLRELRPDVLAGRLSPCFQEFGEGPTKLLWDLDRLRFARLCLYLRLRRPDAVIGYSQFVFRLNANEVRTVVDGNLAELTSLMEQAAANKTD